MTREDKVSICLIAAHIMLFQVLHKTALTIITFSQDGSRMVTGDGNGVVGVWRTHRGLTQVCSYKKDGAVN